MSESQRAQRDLFAVARVARRRRGLTVLQFTDQLQRRHPALIDCIGAECVNTVLARVWGEPQTGEMG